MTRPVRSVTEPELHMFSYRTHILKILPLVLPVSSLLVLRKVIFLEFPWTFSIAGLFAMNIQTLVLPTHLRCCNICNIYPTCSTSLILPYFLGRYCTLAMCLRWSDWLSKSSLYEKLQEIMIQSQAFYAAWAPSVYLRCDSNMPLGTEYIEVRM